MTPLCSVVTEPTPPDLWLLQQLVDAVLFAVPSTPQQCCLSHVHTFYLQSLKVEVCGSRMMSGSDVRRRKLSLPPSAVSPGPTPALAHGLAALHKRFPCCSCHSLVAFPPSGHPKVTKVTKWGQEVALRREGPGVYGSGVQTGGAEADGASWKGSWRTHEESRQCRGNAGRV